MRTAFDISIMAQGDINAALTVAALADAFIVDGFEERDVTPINRIARAFTQFGVSTHEAEVEFTSVLATYNDSGAGDGFVYTLPSPAPQMYVPDASQTAFDIALMLYGDVSKALAIGIDGFGRIDKFGNSGGAIRLPLLEEENDTYRALFGRVVATGATTLNDAAIAVGGAFSFGFDTSSFE